MEKKIALSQLKILKSIEGMCGIVKKPFACRTCVLFSDKVLEITFPKEYKVIADKYKEEISFLINAGEHSLCNHILADNGVRRRIADDLYNLLDTNAQQEFEF